MAYVQTHEFIYSGLHSDTKPTVLDNRMICVETDTGDEYSTSDLGVTWVKSKTGSGSPGYSSTLLADDATITLPTGVTGTLEVIFGDQLEWSTIQVSADGAVENVHSKDANLHLANDDGYYCVYKGTGGAIIKNRTGNPLTVKHKFDYSV
jgi:photosystem II stability/assembly factor-like uncharacterized protein